MTNESKAVIHNNADLQRYCWSPQWNDWMQYTFMRHSSDIHLRANLYGAWNRSRLYEYDILSSVSHILALSSAVPIRWTTFDVNLTSYLRKDQSLLILVAVSRMLYYQGLLLAGTFCLYSTSFALECFRGDLPPIADCQILVSVLYDLGHMPGLVEPKEWGRTMQGDIYSVKIPKSYFLDGPENYNCAVYIDVKDSDSSAVDTFRIEDVARAANAVLGHCLLARSQLGLYV